MTNAAAIPRSEYAILQDTLAALRFRAKANPTGSAIDLTWQLPLNQAEVAPNIIIVRRERRFPGINRKGIFSVVASADDLADGETIYDSQSFQFDFAEVREEKFNSVRIETTRQYDLLGDRRDRQISRTIRHEFRQALNGTETQTRATVCVTDYRSVQAGIIYYYTAFVELETSTSQIYFSNHTQAAALATGQYNHKLFKALPQIHQRLDTTYPPPNSVTPADRNKGQLQRFLEVFEAHADMLHGFVDGLRDLHDINRVDSQFLPHLAHLIGWRLKNYHNEEQQRNELLNAPEVYRTLGTVPNIKAAINRATGWNSEIHEYARNVLLTFDPSRFETLENGETIYLDGSFELIPSAPDEPLPDPSWRSRPIPQGSLDTTDTAALLKIQTRAFDDRAVYTFDSRPLGKQSDWTFNDLPLYNQKRIGIYLMRDRENEKFSPQEGFNLIRDIVAEFLPINVEPVFFTRADFEEIYNTIEEVQEELIL